MEGNTTTATLFVHTLTYLQQAASFLPENPATPYMEYGWKYMTDNYSKFQITVYGSIIAHEVRVILQLCVCNSLLQLLCP